MKILSCFFGFIVALAILIREWNRAGSGMLWFFGIALAVVGAAFAVSVWERVQQRARS